MTSRFTLLAAAGLAGLAFAGCSGADEEGDIPPAPLNPPSGMVRGAGGTAGQVGNAGTGGTGVATAGTGGTGVTPTAGTGGTGVAAGGTGGTAAGGAGGTGGGAIPVGTGFAITPATDGWVAGTTNGVGIQGSFYPFGDYQGTPPGDTDVTLGAFDNPTSICLSGTASQVQGMPLNYTQYYGGGIALNLADPGGGADPTPWSRGTVTGFSFTVTGPTIPDNIRFNATVQGSTDPYCVDSITTGAQTSIQLGTLTAACYNPGGTALPATQALVAIQWQVVTVADAPTPFDFCINNLTALTQ